MNFTYLDLEMNQPSGKIIEVGWCVGDPLTGQCVTTASTLVKIKEELNPEIVKLTGITDEMLGEHGCTLEVAAQNLLNMHRAFRSFMNPVTWGGADMDELRRQLDVEQIPTDENREILREMHLAFGRRWIDVKTLHITFRQVAGLRMQGGLAKSMTKYGLAFHGKKHRAGDDAFNTFRLHTEMLKRLKESGKFDR